MKTFLIWFFVIAAALVLPGVVTHFPFLDIRFDLIWLIVLYISFFVPFIPGAFFVILLGFAQESLGAPFHGMLPLVYLSIYGFVRLSHEQLFFQGVMSQALWVVIFSAISQLLQWVLLAWKGTAPPLDLVSFAGFSFIEGILSLVLFPFLQNRGKVLRDFA